MAKPRRSSSFLLEIPKRVPIRNELEIEHFEDDKNVPFQVEGRDQQLGTALAQNLNHLNAGADPFLQGRIHLATPLLRHLVLHHPALITHDAYLALRVRRQR
jgi:hypothetical protein